MMDSSHRSSAPLLDAFYPIVPNSRWLQQLAPLGIRTVQLRLKDMPAQVVRDEIANSLKIAKQFGLQLIVNDFWREATAQGAEFVHLGQEDLAAADLRAIKAAKIGLGVSTHDEAELAKAMAAEPDYIALGPIYETRLKAMPWAPQGLGRVRQWKQKLGQIPLVAIGGLTPERAGLVIDAGADSVAVITDFLTHEAPESRVLEWVAWSKTAQRNAVNL